ncbi:MAG: hypothetical protein J6A67_01305 [Clostridia bacterium]|nr:hypothetical protein [Clostridia bacterium]
MSKILKKGLALFLALVCAMNLAVVSFAQEEKVSYLDEETGTLYLMNDNWFEDLKIGETEDEIYAFVDKVKVLHIDEGFDIDSNGTIWLSFSNLEKIIIDEDITKWFVYDNAVYYNYSGDEGEACIFVYYPPKCKDKDIVLHPDATQLSPEAFQLWDNIKGEMLPYTNEYNLYIVGDGQFDRIKNDRTVVNFLYFKFTNVYVNDTRESIGEIMEPYGCTLDVLNKNLIYSSFNAYYYYRYNSEKYSEHSDALSKIYEEVEQPQDPEDLVALNEYNDAIYSKFLEYIDKYEYTEFTEEEYALTGNQGENYAYMKMFVDYYYALYLYYNNRGNPVKPLSTLTSGTCGEGVEWAIDHESGVLSITGNGAIADNYSGFDVFKNIVTAVEIGNAITAIGENVFTGFTALTETKFDGTQAQWNTVAVADGNDDLLKNVTVNPDPPVEPEEEPTLGDKIVGFFNKIADFFVKIYNWIINLFKR